MRRLRRALFVAIVAGFLVACGGSGLAPEPRTLSAHARDPVAPGEVRYARLLVARHGGRIGLPAADLVDLPENQEPPRPWKGDYVLVAYAGDKPVDAVFVDLPEMGFVDTVDGPRVEPVADVQDVALIAYSADVDRYELSNRRNEKKASIPASFLGSSVLPGVMMPLLAGPGGCNPPDLLLRLDSGQKVAVISPATTCPGWQPTAFPAPVVTPTALELDQIEAGLNEATPEVQSAVRAVGIFDGFEESGQCEVFLKGEDRF